jgi:deoxycytidylate deaminase
MCNRNRNCIIQPLNNNAKLLRAATANYSLQPVVAIVHHEWVAYIHQSISRLKDKQTCTRYVVHAPVLNCQTIWDYQTQNCKGKNFKGKNHT